MDAIAAMLFLIALILAVNAAISASVALKLHASIDRQCPSSSDIEVGWSKEPNGVGLYLVQLEGEDSPSAAECVDDGDGLTWHVAGRYVSSDLSEIRRFCGPIPINVPGE